MQSVCGRGAPSGRMENGSSICTPISSMPVVPHGDEWLRSRADALNSAKTLPGRSQVGSNEYHAREGACSAAGSDDTGHCS